MWSSIYLTHELINNKLGLASLTRKGDIMGQNGLFGSWLTVNRSCNFRCGWCYAEGTRYAKTDNMTLDMAKELITLLRQMEIMHMIFIGGEPLLWSSIFVANSFAREKGLTTSLITNGTLFARPRIINNLQESPFDRITVSLKAGEATSHKRLTRSGLFGQVVQGMQNLLKNGLQFDVSITLNTAVAESLVDIVKLAIDNGASSVSIQFCSSVFQDEKPDVGFMMKPEEVVRCIVASYPELDRYTKGRLVIEQSLPMCIWPAEFMEMLRKKQQILFGCHVLKRVGLIFGSKGGVIPCNCLHEFPLGQYRQDFSDAKSFARFWERQEVVEFYDKIIAYPSQACIGCEHYDYCGGGCPLQWFVFDPNHIIPNRKEVKR